MKLINNILIIILSIILIINLTSNIKADSDLNTSLFNINHIMEFRQTAYGLTSADFDNDDDMDFAVSYSEGWSAYTEISIFFNNGNGEFNEKVDIFSFGERITSLDSGDYDNDGDIDIIFGYSESIQYHAVYGVVEMLLNDGNNNFIERMQISKRGTEDINDTEPRINPEVTSADYDKDNDIDLLVGDNSGQVEFYLNDGNGNFTSVGTIYDYGNFSWGLSSSDFDGDGDVDFIVTSQIYDQETQSYVSAIYLKLNQINSEYSENSLDNCFEQTLGEMISHEGYYLGCLSSLDYDQDNDIDFIAGVLDSIYLFTNEAGEFESQLIYILPISSEGYSDDLSLGGITTSDYNDDGCLDFITGGVQGDINLFLNNCSNSAEDGISKDSETTSGFELILIIIAISLLIFLKKKK